MYLDFNFKGEFLVGLVFCLSFVHHKNLSIILSKTVS